MAAMAYWLSLYMRLGEEFWTWPDHVVLWGALLFVVVSAPVFLFFRLDRGIWRYASTSDVLAIFQAAALANLIFVVALFMVNRLLDFPRSAALINVAVLAAGLALPRLAFRALKDGSLRAIFETMRPGDGTARVPVLLFGASDAAELFIREMGRRRDAPYRVVGLIDDRDHRVGRRIHGVDVLGTGETLAEVVAGLERKGDRPRRLVVARDELEGAALGHLLETADRLGMSLARLPRLTDLRMHDAEAAPALDVRPVQLEDLLGRPHAVLDRAGVDALIAGRRVLVTGAGGTIGGELVRQIAELKPARLILFDNAEFLLYQIDLELRERYPDLTRVAVLGDVRDRARLEHVLEREQPELVFHAAAFKHVPLVEANPNEGVLTNVIGTRNVADACRAAGVRLMVQISTDKAVNPSSVMGATKRLAEAYVQALDVVERRRGPVRTRFVTVRFGNVLGSTGSVVPLFQRQLAAGGPLTVTHPDITRYFMTVREAVELVLQASALDADHANGDAAEDEGGAIHVLDMGEPVRIIDLARQMIRLAGRRPEIDVKIEITGLRPGEKLSEELFHGAEALVPTAVKGVQRARPRTVDWALLARALDELAEHARARRTQQTLAAIERLIPEYRRDTGGSPGAETVAR
jgi:O-antigen biosynthesis protein WbqV